MAKPAEPMLTVALQQPESLSAVAPIRLAKTPAAQPDKLPSAAAVTATTPLNAAATLVAQQQEDYVVLGQFVVT